MPTPWEEYMSKLVRVLAALFISLAVAASVAASAKDAAPGQFEILTLSNRADHISGGDVLVEVRVPRTVPLHQVTLWLNGLDVTDTFRTDTAARTMRGVVTGLEGGQNEFLADSNGRGRGRPRASLTITSHPIGGPVLLGSQTTPWICATPTPTAESGNTPATNASGLSTFAIDAQCNIATEYKLFYRTTAAGCSSALPDPSPPAAPPTNNCFKPYTPGSAPADLAMTTTTAGLTVPYIVRVERGTINRGIYDIAVLFDPANRGRRSRRRRSGTARSSTASARRRASRGSNSARHRTGPTTRRCRAASWSSTTASPIRPSTRTAS